MLNDQEHRKSEELLRLAILYRIDRAGEKLGVVADTADHAFVIHALNRMDVAGLLDPDDSHEFLRLTDMGRQALAEMVSVFDRTLQFNVFARVAIAADLPGEDMDEGGRLFANLHDPRFGLPDDPATDEFVDMRLAMLSFFAETHEDGPQPFDPYLVVFLQKLVDGELVSENFWRRMRIGVVFAEIRDIVESAYQWRTMDPDKDMAAEKMRGLFATGMVELRKREGDECGACGAALALYAEDARAEGRELEACGNCDRVFGPPPDENLLGQCPRSACGANIYRDDRTCRGCGAHINPSLPPGTIETTTETVTETDVWGHDYGYYGYVPIPYYDPYVYPADLFFAGLIVGAVLL